MSKWQDLLPTVKKGKTMTVFPITEKPSQADQTHG